MTTPFSSASSTDAREELADRLALLVGGESAKAIVSGVLADYEITRKEKALVIYNQGETEYLIKRFIVAKKVKGCTDRTCKLYFGNLTRMYRDIGKSPTQCDHTDIQACVARLIVKGTSKAYQQNIIRTFSSFYGWMFREELIGKNPMLKIDPIKTNPKHKDAFTDMEVEQIRMACRTSREKALVEVLLSTGCRITEASHLTREDVREDAIRIIGKGEKERSVYLNAKAVLTIRAYLAERSDQNPYLFPASVMSGQSFKQMPGDLKKPEWYRARECVSTDKPQDQSSLESIIRNIGKRAGVKNCHPHRFRRTCATLALRRGMNVVHVQQMLGHSDLSTTQRYLDIGEEELREAHKRYVV